MKLGTHITWTSQAGGNARTKRGAIVEVVPAGALPLEEIPGLGNTLPRDHESYVVRAVQDDRRSKHHDRPRLYWPRVSALRVER